MKSVLLFCFLIAILEYTNSLRMTPEEVSAEILAYGRQRGRDLRLQQGGASSDRMSCYETYKSFIAKSAERSKTESEACNTSADAQRKTELEKAQKNRSYLNNQTQIIQNSLNACTAEEDMSKYFICLIDGDKENQEAMESIARWSLIAYDRLHLALEAVESKEIECIYSVHVEAKKDIDSAFSTLQDCVMHGYVQN